MRRFAIWACMRSSLHLILNKPYSKFHKTSITVTGSLRNINWSKLKQAFLVMYKNKITVNSKQLDFCGFAQTAQLVKALR